MLRTFFSRLVATFRPEQQERRLTEEMETHLDELGSAGRRAFGPIETVKEQYRDQARFRPLENLIRDTRFALRQYNKNRAFTIAAVLSLALGIGANAALFSFVNAILLKHLPVPAPERLFSLKGDTGPLTLTYEQLNDLNRQFSQSGSLLGRFPMDVSVSLGERAEWFPAELVTGDYFRTLAIHAERGRLLNQSDLDAAAGNPVCIISDRLWKSKFEAAPDVIGRTVRINTRPYKIVGVTEPGFRGIDLMRPSDLQIPTTRLPDYLPAFAGNPRFDWRSRLYLFSTLVRLPAFASRTGAETQLSRSYRAYLAQHKNARSEKLTLVPASGGFESHSKLAKPVSILLGVSLAVLLIACANLATLLLSRTSARTQEFALRLSIGGSTTRIFSQVLIESALLAISGTAAGLAVAYAIAQILLAFLNRTAPTIHQLHISIDGHVLGFTALAAALSVLLFGIAPALQAARSRPAGSFSAGNTRVGTGLRKTFVAAQIALSFLVVLSAGLLTATLRNVATLDFGYAPDQIVTIDIRPASGGYSGASADQFYARVVERLRSVPGVRAAASAFGVQLDGGFKTSLNPQGYVRQERQVNLVGVNPGYFDTFGARLLSGRDFNASDAKSQRQVYIISNHLAQTYFHGENPVGRDLLSGDGKMQVIGVVSDIRDENLRDGSLDTVYQDIGQLLSSSLLILVRCAGSCEALQPTLRAAVHKLDPNTPILAMHTMKTEIQGTFSTEQALGFLSMLFGALALVLVAAGLYGVLSYTLTRRTREIGIRTAVGALPSDIIGLFASEALLMLGLGTLIGVPLSLAAVNLLRSQLFGVTPHNPTALLLCFACIATTVLLASIAPIRRALRIAPQQALRID